jgi:lysophospholipase L1-like esterase
MKFLVHILLCATSHLHAQSIPSTTKRILFLGNSITYAGGYINYIETHWLQNHPNQPIEFINMGLPSETVSGLSEPNHADGKFPRPDLHERLSRIIRLVKPDLVFACYGMNDGIYLPFDTARFNRFKEGIQWLHQQYVSQGIPIIHITPPVYDEEKGRVQGYAVVLDRYADWLLSLRDSSWQIADVHYPMKNSGKQLAADGVHPGNEGHRIMAKAILAAVGESLEYIDTDLLQLVAERQAIMKDAWLTAAGHKRPMQPGLPLPEARSKTAPIDIKIKARSKAVLNFTSH